LLSHLFNLFLIGFTPPSPSATFQKEICGPKVLVFKGGIEDNITNRRNNLNPTKLQLIFEIFG
jgi:hypothetical protein